MIKSGWKEGFSVKLKPLPMSSEQQKQLARGMLPLGKSSAITASRRGGGGGGYREGVARLETARCCERKQVVRRARGTPLALISPK